MYRHTVRRGEKQSTRLVDTESDAQSRKTHGQTDNQTDTQRQTDTRTHMQRDRPTEIDRPIETD